MEESIKRWSDLGFLPENTNDVKFMALVYDIVTRNILNINNSFDNQLNTLIYPILFRLLNNVSSDNYISNLHNEINFICRDLNSHLPLESHPLVDVEFHFLRAYCNEYVLNYLR